MELDAGSSSKVQLERHGYCQVGACLITRGEMTTSVFQNVRCLLYKNGFNLFSLQVGSMRGLLNCRYARPPLFWVLDLIRICMPLILYVPASCCAPKIDLHSPISERGIWNSTYRKCRKCRTLKFSCISIHSHDDDDWSTIWKIMISIRSTGPRTP